MHATAQEKHLYLLRHAKSSWSDPGLADHDRLTNHLDEVERTLRVAPVPMDIMGRNGRLLLEAATTLGWQAAPIPRNAPGLYDYPLIALGVASIRPTEVADGYATLCGDGIHAPQHIVESVS